MLTKEEMTSPKMVDFYTNLDKKVKDDIKQFTEMVNKTSIEYRSAPNSIVRLTNDGMEAKGIISINDNEEEKYVKYRAYSINGFDSIGIELVFGIDKPLMDLDEIIDKSSGFVKYSYNDGDVSVTEVKNELQKILSNDELLSPKMKEIYARIGNKVSNDMEKLEEARKYSVRYQINPSTSISLTDNGITEDGIVSIPDNDQQIAKYKAYTDFSQQGVDFDLKFKNNNQALESGKEENDSKGQVSFSYLDGSISVWEVDDQLDSQAEEERGTSFQKRG